MNKQALSIVVALAMLAAAWAALGQDDKAAEEQRGRWVKGRFENLSEDDKAALKTKVMANIYRMGSMLIRGPERQQSIKTMEEQVAKLKAMAVPQFEGAFADLPAEEQAAVANKTRLLLAAHSRAIGVITQQLGHLGRSREEDPKDARYVILSDHQLKQIRDTAIKEKATQTSALVGLLIPGEGGRGTGRGNPPQDPQPDSTAAPSDRQR